MNLSRRTSLVLLAIATFALAASAQNGRPSFANIFTITGEARSVPVADRTSPASVREAPIEVDAAALEGALTMDRIAIPLFDDASFVAKKRNIEVRGEGDLTWRGKLSSGGFEGDVILTLKSGYLFGLIYTPKAVYEIAVVQGEQKLMQLDQRLFPECAGDIDGEAGGSKVESDAPLAGVDSADRIDVLVVYTPATRNLLGGAAASAAFAQSAIDTSNTTYINSKISQRVRLVHTAEYNYTETSSASSDLSALRNNASVQALRNTHKADLVAMIGEIQGACGIGYLMGTATGGNANNGFTFTGRTCAVGNLSFPHELGHNMGSQHNPENGSGATYPYAYGHYVDGQFRTVMSYVDPCPSGCTRVPYFSNPSVFYNGMSTGIANARDNARSINLTDDAIASYRYSGSSLTMTNFLGPDMLSSLWRSWFYWSTDNVIGSVRVQVSRDEGVTWETAFDNLDNDGSHVIYHYGTQTPRGRLRIASVNDPAVTDSSNVNISLR